MQKTTNGFMIYNFKTASYLEKRDRLTTKYTKNIECAYFYYNMDEADFNLKQLLLLDNINGNGAEYHEIIKAKRITKTLESVH